MYEALSLTPLFLSHFFSIHTRKISLISMWKNLFVLQLSFFFWKTEDNCLKFTTDFGVLVSFFISFFLLSSSLNTARKLNVHKTFNSYYVSRGFLLARESLRLSFNVFEMFWGFISSFLDWLTQQTVIGSKSTWETLPKVVKYVQS